jgi:hypothetical protein
VAYNIVTGRAGMNKHMHTREGPAWGVVRGEGVDRIALSVVLCCGTRDVVSSERVTPHGPQQQGLARKPTKRYDSRHTD